MILGKLVTIFKIKTNKMIEKLQMLMLWKILKKLLSGSMSIKSERQRISWSLRRISKKWKRTKEKRTNKSRIPINNSIPSQTKRRTTQLWTTGANISDLSRICKTWKFHKKAYTNMSLRFLKTFIHSNKPAPVFSSSTFFKKWME